MTGLAVLYSNTSMLYQPIQDRGHIRDIQEGVSRSKPSKSRDGSENVYVPTMDNQ